MKRLAFLLITAMSMAGLAPAKASDEIGLGPTGLLQAKRDGFDGSSFEFAVVGSSGLNFLSPSVKNAVKSEACFSTEEEWREKCPNGKARQVGTTSSENGSNSYSHADSLIYSLAGSSKMIAPRASAHAIRAIALEETFPDVIRHLLSKNISAVFFVDVWSPAKRGMEVNCDAGFPEAAKLAKQARDVGIALISDPGLSGDAYGLSFPACLSAVIPVGNLDSSGQIAESNNVGPGLAVSHARYESLDPGLLDGEIHLSEWDSVTKAMAVAGGIYGALLSAGYSADVALEALTQSNTHRDDVIVKNIPLINYLDAKAWARAKSGESVEFQISGVTQVGKNEIAAVLKATPAKISTAEVIAYEIYDFDTAKWVRTPISESGLRAVRISPQVDAGWLRLVLRQPSATQVTGPKAFFIESDFTPEYGVDQGTLIQGAPLSGVPSAEPSESSLLDKSSVDWPAIDDPALELIELDYAREMQITGKGVTVAIIDDGYQLDHPYLSPDRVVEGLCLETDESCPNGTNKQFGSSAVEPKFSEKLERGDHGTMVAGTIGGYPTKDATGGIAPEVNFIVARVDLNGSDENGDFVNQALEWIYELSFEYTISSVNMSFGYSRYQRDQILNGSACEDDSTFQAAAQKLRNRGIAPVVASGNDGLVEGIYGPSCEHAAIAVGAVDDDGSIINYSNISEEVDMVAPAKAKTSLGDRTFAQGSGTSNAAPVVSGAFALAKQLRPDLSVEEVLFAMRESGDLVDDVYVKELPTINIRKFLDYLSLGSSLDQLRPKAKVQADGLKCEVEFDSTSALRMDMRYRLLESDSWLGVNDIASPFVLGNLAPHSTYELEIGGLFDDLTLWSSRQTCQTGDGLPPSQIASASAEARGSNWLIAYVPLAESDGPIDTLNFLAKDGSEKRAIPLGSDRYYFYEIDNGDSLNVAFSNEWGRPAYTNISIPAFSLAPFKASSLLRGGFRGSNLSLAHKAQLERDIGGFSGVISIVCTGYVLSTTSSSARKTIELRARKACEESKKLHEAAVVSIKIKDTRVTSFYGAVGVVVEGIS